MLAVVIAYLLGTVPSGLLISRMFGVHDIRKEGSGNIGATNVWRVIGPRAAIWVYIMDIGKGAAAVLMARGFQQSLVGGDVFLVMCAAAVILGNIFPFYLRFRGGKGVNTALGAVAVLLPVETFICVAVFLTVVSASRFISLGSMAAACSLCPVILVETYMLGIPVPSVYLYLSIMLAFVILIAHRRNIGRLLSGTESRFSFSSKAGRAGSHV
jgi:glycerol-3-phosphate acyltransferase PlsY